MLKLFAEYTSKMYSLNSKKNVWKDYSNFQIAMTNDSKIAAVGLDYINENIYFAIMHKHKSSTANKQVITSSIKVYF